MNSSQTQISNQPFLKKITNHDRIILWGKMDDIVLKLKNKKIVNYWKKNGTPCKIKYDCIMTNRYNYHKLFTNNVFTECLNVFRHCINMSLDNDVEEYLNSLDNL